MALITNNFEGGTNGTTITTGNSGGASGTAFANVTGPFAFDTTGAYNDLGGRVQIASSTAWRSYHSWSTVTQVAGRLVFTFNGSVPNSFSICGSVNNSFASVFRFGTGSTGKMTALDSTAAILASSASALSAGTAYVVEYQIQPGNATNNGIISAQGYTAAAPGTLLINFSSSTANLGTVTGIVRGQLGNNDTVTSCDLTFDEIVYNTGTLTAIGPPSVSATAGLAASTAVPPSGTEDAIAIGMTIRGS